MSHRRSFKYLVVKDVTNRLNIFIIFLKNAFNGKVIIDFILKPPVKSWSIPSRHLPVQSQQ